MSSETYSKLLEAATFFCDAFANQDSPDKIYAYFSNSVDVRAFEHGLPELAPFLGREFTGTAGIKKYFELIGSHLKYEDMSFDKFVVDVKTLQVSCRGHARFIATKTDQGWDETFAYILGYDNEFLVKSYEIWADTGAAYLALNGKLQQ